MKANYMNYFKAGKLYQWDENRGIFTIETTNITDEFCLDKKGMETLLKFKAPEVKKNEHTVSVKEGKVKAELKMVQAFLQIPELKETTKFKVDVDKLKKAVKFVNSDDKIKKNPVLAGVSLRGGFINATDGLFAYRSKGVSDENIDVVLSKQFIDLLAPLQGEVEMSASQNIIACKVKEQLCISNLIAGKYPPLDKIYANGFGGATEAKMSTSEIKNILSFSMDKEDNLILSKNKAKIVDKTFIDADIDFNDYIIEQKYPLARFQAAVSCVDSDNLVIKFTKIDKPILVDETILLMPIVRG